MLIQIRKARKGQSRLRFAVDGPSGSGKTYTALRFAFALASAYDKVLVVDTEHETAAKYIGEDPDGLGAWPEFATVALDNFHPQNYIDAIEAGENGGYEVIVIDSLSHAWEGEGGVLDLHDKATKRSGTGNSWTAWKDVTPIHRQLVEAMLQSRCHIIATMRSKVEYVQTTDDKGKTVIKKIGMAPIQRPGVDYEFDIVADMDVDHNMVISKTRFSRIVDAVVSKPGAKWFAEVKTWLNTGAPIPERAAPRQAGQEVIHTAPPENWTTDADYLRPIHDRMKAMIEDVSLDFPAKGEESAHERFKREGLDLTPGADGLCRLRDFKGTPEQYMASFQQWLTEELDEQMAAGGAG